MDLSNIPSKSEVMSRKPRPLAPKKKIGFAVSDKVVTQENVTGADFLEMRGSDLQVLSSPHAQKVKPICDRSQKPRVNNKHHKRQAECVQEEDDYEHYDTYDNEDLNCSLAKITLQKHQHFYQEGSVHKEMRLSTSYAPPQNDSWKSKRANQPFPAQSSKMTEALDPAWYGGELTRREAEEALREVDQDGAFVVRDSSEGRAEHPYTLMVLNEDKIYNIKIRKQEEMFFLGTGLHNDKSFPGVREIITHHAHAPLLLIDAPDRGSSETHRLLCRLLHPVGLNKTMG